MAIKEIRSITVQFEGARLSEEHWATDEFVLNLTINNDSGILSIYEEDKDEKRIVVAYAPGQWSTVRLVWKDRESHEVKYVRNPNPSSHSAEMISICGKPYLQLPGRSRDQAVPAENISDAELENYYGWKRV